MGKPLIQQRRGKASSTFRARSFTARADVKMPIRNGQCTVTELTTSTHHTAPLMQITFEDGQQAYVIAPEGIKVGDKVGIGSAPLEAGNTLKLADLPIGALVYNIESVPGDGGRFVRGSGTAGRVVDKQQNGVTVLLPSKKRKTFNADCRATLGTVAGGGRLEKPLMRAGTKYHKMKAKNKYWPLVSGAAMNAVNHPFGGKRSSRKGRPTIAPKNAPKGRKVGMIRPRKTGRARGTRVRTN